MRRFCWIKTRRRANLGLGEETQGVGVVLEPRGRLESLSGTKKRKKEGEREEEEKKAASAVGWRVGGRLCARVCCVCASSIPSLSGETAPLQNHL